LKTIILGKRSYLSNKLQSKIHKSRIYNFTDFENFIFKDKSNFNLIINSFYPSKKISKIKSFKEFYTQSIGKLSNLLDTIDSKKINKIIYTSSASVYGSVNELYYSSDNNNRTLYSSAKLLNEALLNNFCQKRNINLIIVRLFNMYGPKENFSIIYKLINSIKKNEKISLINKGQSTRDFIHVDDVVDIYLKLLKIKKSAIYDVGSGFGINIMQILNFLKIPKNKILYKKIKVDEISSSIANLKKLREDINKDTFIKLETFLKKETNIKINGSILKKNIREVPNTINKNISGSIIYGSGFAGKKIASKLIKLKNINVSFFCR
jgi:UDP-glucose 4-epimerase